MLSFGNSQKWEGADSNLLTIVNKFNEDTTLSLLRVLHKDSTIKGSQRDGSSCQNNEGSIESSLMSNKQQILLFKKLLNKLIIPKVKILV